MSRKVTFEDTVRKLEGGQQEALLRKLFRAAGGESGGQEGFAAILRDELAIQLVDAMIKIVDATGRFIPLKGMTKNNDFVEPNRKFGLTQPEINPATILARIQQFFSGQTFVSTQEFSRRVAELLEQIRTMRQMRGLLNGVHFPICLPQMSMGDKYGYVLERVFLDAVKRSYEEKFPGCTFTNYRAGTLDGQVGVVDESRHGQLIEKMKHGPVVGLYFPNPMQGYSILADRRLIQICPTGFLLTGAIDTAVAVVAEPEVLTRNTPVLDCAANTWQSTENSLDFEVYGIEAGFGCRLLNAGGNFSGGLLFVG